MKNDELEESYQTTVRKELVANLKEMITVSFKTIAKPVEKVSDDKMVHVLKSRKMAAELITWALGEIDAIEASVNKTGEPKKPEDAAVSGREDYWKKRAT